MSRKQWWLWQKTDDGTAADRGEESGRNRGLGLRIDENGAVEVIGPASRFNTQISLGFYLAQAQLILNNKQAES